MRAVGFKSRQTLDNIIKRGEIKKVKVGAMAIIVTSPAEFLQRKVREQTPPKPRGRPKGRRAPAPEDRPNRLGRPLGSRDKQSWRRHGTTQQAEPVPIAARSAE